MTDCGDLIIVLGTAGDVYNYISFMRLSDLVQIACVLGVQRNFQSSEVILSNQEVQRICTVSISMLSISTIDRIYVSLKFILRSYARQFKKEIVKLKRLRRLCRNKRIFQTKHMNLGSFIGHRRNADNSNFRIPVVQCKLFL